MQRFYHSRDWGFDVSITDKKIIAKQFLTSLNLPCCIKIINDFNDVRSLFAKGDKEFFWCMIVDKETKKYHVFLNINNFDSLYEKIAPLLDNEFCLNRLTLCLVEKMYEIPGSFTAIIICDGKGNAIVEYIRDTVDNRFLSSGGNPKTPIEKIIFNDYKLVYCDDYNILITMHKYIKICLFFSGYYECSYAAINNKKDLYFSYYSNKKIYQNLSLEYFNDMLKYRCAYLSLIEMCD